MSYAFLPSFPSLVLYHFPAWSHIKVIQFFPINASVTLQQHFSVCLHLEENEFPKEKMQHLNKCHKGEFQIELADGLP